MDGYHPNFWFVLVYGCFSYVALLINMIDSNNLKFKNKINGLIENEKRNNLVIDLQ